MDALGKQLQEVGLNEAALAEIVGPASSGEDVPLVLNRYRTGDPRAALVRLFVLGDPVARDLLPVSADALADAGLVELDGETATARFRLAPFAGLLVAHDGSGAGVDQVTGVNAASRTLATLTVRRPVERALEIGTGSGVQALLCARHAETVVATDVNVRALEYTEIGARLNGLPLELRQGSLFEPVEGETFDLVVANPPFVISPDHDFLFRDSGLPGDSICREVVRGAAAHLRPGGFATVLCNWICRNPTEPWETLVEWVDGLECDALLVSHGTADPFHYASRWNEPVRSDPERYAAAVGRWLDYYERETIAAIGFGAVILRGRQGQGWVRGLAAQIPALGSAGDHILRLFAATDHLGALEHEEALLDERFALVRGHRLDQTLVYTGEYDVAGVSMSLAAGVGLVGSIEPEALPLLFALTPDQPLREIAAQSGVDPALALVAVRRLYELGLIERYAPDTARSDNRGACPAG
jgi:methylase of polypeptide subunit release factors